MVPGVQLIVAANRDEFYQRLIIVADGRLDDFAGSAPGP